MISLSSSTLNLNYSFTIFISYLSLPIIDDAELVLLLSYDSKSDASACFTLSLYSSLLH